MSKHFYIGALVLGILLLGFRYVAKHNELENQLRFLQSKLNAADATIAQIQDFEQKLRSLTHLGRSETSGGFGPISVKDEQVMKKAEIKTIASLESEIDELGRRAAIQEESLSGLYESLKNQQSLLASTPLIWPAHGWVTSQFGYRISPFTGERELHGGIDIAAHPGTKVLATADGVVSETGVEEGYGNVVAIDHGHGIVTRYGHNSKILVKPGQRIWRGEPVALVGDTGRATGPHVHYEIRVDGVPVNPSRYLLN